MGVTQELTGHDTKRSQSNPYFKLLLSIKYGVDSTIVSYSLFSLRKPHSPMESEVFLEWTDYRRESPRCVYLWGSFIWGHERAGQISNSLGP